MGCFFFPPLCDMSTSVEVHYLRQENKRLQGEVQKYRAWMDRIRLDALKQGYVLIDEWDATKEKVSTLILKSVPE